MNYQKIQTVISLGTLFGVWSNLLFKSFKCPSKN